MQELVTTALSPSTNQYRIDIESPFAGHTEKQLPAIQLNPVWKDQLLQRSMGLQVLHSYTADSLSRMEHTDSYFRWQPDWSYILDEYTRFTTMEEVVIEFIIGLRFRRINNKTNPFRTYGRSFRFYYWEFIGIIRWHSSC
ncbi:MAG: hypothetical protein LUG96_00950 [Tannerellaceae bacterium]|nr:hypothetical protein [Tannerellaceae bacterium]